MKKKKGQFFLIAALLIIFFISTLFFYKNRISTTINEDKILSLKEQLTEESSIVIDYGVSNSDNRLKDFLSEVSSDLVSSNPEIGMVFFFGNSSKISVLNLGDNPINFFMDGIDNEVQNVPKSARVGIGEGGVSFKIKIDDPTIASYIKTFNHISGEKITLRINETNYEIPLEKYKNFYFMIKKSTGMGEEYVAIE